MRKLKVWITLCCLSLGTAAVAAPIGPEKATELLARAWMINHRCNVLTPTERDELTGLVARAEIALAGMRSVAAARAAMGRGRAAGTSAACGFESTKAVRDILQAAKVATVAADMDISVDSNVPPVAQKLPPAEKPATQDRGTVIEQPEPAPMIVAQEPPIVIKPIAPRATDQGVKKATRVVAIAKPVRPQRPKVRVAVEKKRKPTLTAVSPAVAAGYGKTAEEYYRELRCRNLSTRAVKAMYAQVLREHRQAVSANGRAKIRQVLRAAQSRAAGRSC
jgi:hypothetical protein